MRTTPARCSAWSKPSRTPTTCRTSSRTTRCPTTSWRSSGDVLTGVEVRPFRADDDIEAELDLRRRAFGPIGAGDRQSWITSIQRNVEAGMQFGAFDDGRLVGSARYHLMRQWWHGRSLPMAGVAGVKAAPEARGRGIGTALMAALLSDIADRGYPLSVLFPTTGPLYRAYGWEIAGHRYEAVLPASALTAFAGPDLPESAESAESAGTAVPNVRRATPADGDAIVAVKGHVHNRLRLTREPAAEMHQSDAWMLRVVDAAAAIAGRGFPAGASVSLALDITDPARPGNSGRWSLEVAGGTGSLTRLGGVGSGSGPAALSVGARGFAALYAGVPVPTLRLAGLAAGGDPAADDALSAAFCGPAFSLDNY